MKRAFLILIAVALTSCGMPSSPRPSGQGGAYKVGSPYKVNGVRYVPREDPSYDRTGIASWYGKKFHGRRTANGERYDMYALSAAHPTLPMPSLVRVTNLKNGRSIVARVNDRGPFARGRIIDMSYRSAQLLGFVKQGTARVRVTFVGQGAATGGSTASSPPPPTQTVAYQPPDQVSFVPVVASNIYVQVGAFSDLGNAARLRDRLDHIGQTWVKTVTVHGGQMHRVRIGPLANVGDADFVLSQVVANGHRGARILIDEWTP